MGKVAGLHLTDETISVIPATCEGKLRAAAVELELNGQAVLKLIGAPCYMASLPTQCEYARAKTLSGEGPGKAHGQQGTAPWCEVCRHSLAPHELQGGASPPLLGLEPHGLQEGHRLRL